MIIPKNSLKNILTIRYNPLEKTEFSGIDSSYFSSTITDSNGILIEKLLQNSLKKIIPPKTKIINVSLSGGIDSTLTLALIRKIYPSQKINCICGVFEDGFNESAIAEKISSQFNSNFQTVKIGSLFTNMPEIVSITSKPKWNTYTHLIAKTAKKSGNLLITGDASDEIFAGYSFRYSKFLNLFQSNQNWKTKVKNYLECHNRDWVPSQTSLFHPSVKFDWNVIYNHFKPFFQNKLEPLQQVMLADFNGKLRYDFIPLINSISDKYNLQIKSPFLDPEIIEKGLQIPINQKFNQKTKKGKLILRKIADRYKIPYLDDKQGFSPGLIEDWFNNGRDICQNILKDKKSYIYSKKIIDFNWVTKAMEKIDNDGDIRYLHRITSILALEIWFKVSVYKDVKTSQKL